MSRGFTLLEMVVVLAILAMATGMAAPAGYRMIQSWREATAVDTALRQLHQLPATARSNGRAWQLRPDDQAGIDAAVPLPDGWQLQLDTPLLVRANGACSDSAGTLHTARQTIRFTVAAPFCTIHRLADE